MYYVKIKVGQERAIFVKLYFYLHEFIWQV